MFKEYLVKNYSRSWKMFFRAKSDSDAKDIAHDWKHEGGEHYVLTCCSDDGRLVFDSDKNLKE